MSTPTTVPAPPHLHLHLHPHTHARADESVPILTAADIVRLRADFPILQRTVNGSPLVYLDSGATSQKPLAVLDAERALRAARDRRRAPRRAHHGGRGDRDLRGGSSAGRLLRRGRCRRAGLDLQRHRGPQPHRIRDLQRIAGPRRESSARFRIGAGDEIVVTEMEHHSNLVPWQELAFRPEPPSA